MGEIDSGLCALSHFEEGVEEQGDPILEKILKYWPGDEMPKKVLDIGCGVGRLMESCKKKGIECHGIEGSPDVHQNCVARGLSVDLLKLEKDTDYPYKDGTFDLIICSQIIEHLTLETGIRLMEESYRLLSDDGMLALFSPSYYNRLNRTFPFHINCYRPSDLREYLVNAGFEEVVHLPEAVPFHNIKPYDENEDFRKRKNSPPLNMLLNALLLIYDSEVLDGTAHFIAYKKRVHEKDLSNRRMLIKSLIENIGL